MKNLECRHLIWLAVLAVKWNCPGAETALPSANPDTNAPFITIDALVADVQEHNPERQFYQAEIAAAKGERRAAGAWANPELSTQIGKKEVRGGGLSDEGAAWAVSVQQTFEWPGRLSLRKAIANRQVQLAGLGFAQFNAALGARSRTLAYQLFAAQQKAAAAKEVAGRFQELREVMVQRDPAGLTPLLETRIIEATELTLQRKSTDSALAAQAALLELNQLRGQPWSQAIRIEPPHLAFGPPAPTELLWISAQTNNFELQMRRAELEQQGFKVSLARKEGYPSLTVGPYYSDERAGDREQQVGIGLSVPLPLWNRNKGNVETAAARQKQAETTLHLAQRTVEREILEQTLTYQTRLAEMNRWRPDSVEEFRKAAELADRHYRLGAVPLAIYVELQKQYLEAVEALLDTEKEALEAAQKLELLTGLPPSLWNKAAKEEPK